MAPTVASVAVEKFTPEVKKEAIETADKIASAVVSAAVEALTTATIVEKTEMIETPDKIASAVATVTVDSFNTSMVKVEAPETPDKTASAVAAAVVETLTPSADAEENSENLNVSPPPAKKSKNMPHPCELCGLVSSSKYNCKRHQRRKHPNGECGMIEAAEEASVEICSGEDAPKLISHAHLYHYGNGMYAMITNMIHMNSDM